MEIKEIKDLMAQFDASSLTEFSFKNADDELKFSKHDRPEPVSAPVFAGAAPLAATEPASLAEAATPQPAAESSQLQTEAPATSETAEGELVESPLVGVVYLAPAPDKPSFVSVGDSVKKGQTLMIIEAMKVMNEVPAPRDGVITEILVANEEVADFGKGLVRIK